MYRQNESLNLERNVRVCFLWAMLASIVSLGPVAAHLWNGSLSLHSIDRWVVMLFFTVLMTMATSALMLLVPHRTNIRWVAIWLTLVAAAYAMLLAVFTFAGADHSLLVGLDLADEFLFGHGILWIGIMTLLSSAASIGSHRSASRIVQK